MKTNVKLLMSEVKEIAALVQNVQALYCLHQILTINPERVTEFGFSWDDFSNVENDIRSADNNCRNWWISISKKYALPLDSKFSINFENQMLSIVEENHI